MHTYIPISPSSCISLPPSLSHPSRWSQSTELISWCYAAAYHQLFYIWQCIYINATLSLCPSLLFPLPTSSSPFSRSASLFLSYHQVHQKHLFFRFHIYVLAYGICFSPSDLLHSVGQTLDPSTSLKITQFRFLLWNVTRP